MGLVETTVVRAKNLTGADVVVTGEVTRLLAETVTLEGKPMIVVKDESIAPSTTITVTCDGPDCAGFDGEGPTIHHWNQTLVEGELFAIPNEAYRILQLHLMDGTRLAFCGTGCLLDFLKRFRPLLSPEEQNSNVVGIDSHAKFKPVQKMDDLPEENNEIA